MLGGLPMLGGFPILGGLPALGGLPMPVRRVLDSGDAEGSLLEAT